MAPRIALLHTNREYADSLAATIDAGDWDYDVEVISRIPVQRRLARLHARRFDLIQTDESFVNGVIGAGSSLLRRTPMVFCVRGWADYTNAHGEFGRLRKHSIRARTRATVRQASSVIFISEAARVAFTEAYAVNGSRVVNRPIDVDHYRSGRPQGSDGTTILTVTNLRYARKLLGIRTVLQGLRKAFDQYEGLRYRIAGDGRHFDSLQDEVENYPHRDRVELLGYRDDVPDLLAYADLFVYVSYLDSFGTCVVEAQAAGLPVIGGDASGVPEAVGDGGLVCPATPDGVERAVLDVLGDEALRRELSEASEHRMATYNETCAAGHVAVWEDVLGRS